ncbi:MAG: flagellar biosynthetic protein FliO [Pseudomonadota bacterium]|nr:flagellar biosynthetic protein FliO [Pseudomonadota bacterium]
MDSIDYLRYLAALVMVLGLVAGGAWAARRFGLAPRMGIAGAGRIGVVAVQSLDARRRLVLVRRDDREHLLLVGPNSELLIESGIVRPTTEPRP